VPESLAAKKLRTQQIVGILKQTYPDAKCSLTHNSAFQLLIATILSAQCTDARVNIVTPALFAKYPTPETLAKATLPQIEKIIQTTGFFRAKAKSLKAASADIAKKHAGKVPDDMDALTQLRGVGRKTANVVLGNAFGKNIGIVVDTHVGRLSERLALTKNTDPVKIEEDLVKLVAQNDWTVWSHLLIYHGRAVCTARNPKCEQCRLLPYCPTGPRLIKEKK
jgi:endonuclease-3